MLVEILLLVLLCWYLYKDMIRPANFPPGPINFPILGSLPHFRGTMLDTLKMFQARYGSMFSLNIGSKTRAVVVSDYELIKELSKREEFTYRPDLGARMDFRHPDLHGNMTGIMFGNGDEWREQTRFTLKALRDLGFGKTSMESIILEEVSKTVEFLRKDLNTPTNTRNKLNIPVLNALWKIITGQTFEYDDPRLIEIIEKVDLFMSSSSNFGALSLFPWLKHFFPEQTGYATIKRSCQDVETLVQERYQNHLDTYEEGSPRDFIDSFIAEMRSSNPGSSFHGERGRHHLFSSINDLFIGGSDTTSNTLAFTIYYLAKNQEIQSKLQSELDRVVDRDRLPCLDDRPNCHYLEAVMQEVTRITSLGFTGIPRMAGKDTSLGGYTIPKGTQIFTFLYSILHDPEHWNDPGTFRPERFLGPDGTYVPDEWNLAFGTGKRGCIGKTLAMLELFLFLGGMFQAFQFRFPDGEAEPELKPNVGLILTCPDYRIVVTERAK